MKKMMFYAQKRIECAVFFVVYTEKRNKYAIFDEFYESKRSLSERE